MLSSAVSAQSLSTAPLTSRDQASISDAVQQTRGRIAINQTSGHGNLQANQLTIGIGDAATAAANSAQLTGHQPLSRAASARIDGHAFAHTQGALAINQSAGAGNAQLNLLMFGTGATQASLSQRIAVIDDAALAGVGANQPTASIAPTGAREAVIGATSLVGSQGVVQINQSAGNGNASINAIVLQLPGAAL